MLLPLLAAGFGGKYLGGMLEDRAEENDIERASERQQRLIDSLPEGYSGDDYARGAFGMGILDPEQYGRTGFADQRQAADNAAAMARQRVSSGPGYMNAQLARDQFETQQREVGEMRDWARGQMAQNGTASQRQAAGNPFTPGAVLDGVAQNYVDRLTMTQQERLAEQAQIAQSQAILDTQPGVTAATNAQNQGVVDTQQDVTAARANEDRMLREDGFVDDVYFAPGEARDFAVGQALAARGIKEAGPIVPMSPGDMESAYSGGQQMANVLPIFDDIVSFLDESTLAGRTLGSNDQARLQARIDSSLIPALGVLENTGVIEEGAAKRYAERITLGGRKGWLSPNTEGGAKARAAGVEREIVDAVWRNVEKLRAAGVTDDQLRARGIDVGAIAERRSGWSEPGTTDGPS